MALMVLYIYKNIYFINIYNFLSLKFTVNKMTFSCSFHSKSLSRIHIGNKPKTGTVKNRDTETEGGESHAHTNTHTPARTQEKGNKPIEQT
jgi:hypothetical protein